jgi:flagellar biosynthesis/type III secretory pathway protein FliH
MAAVERQAITSEAPQSSDSSESGEIPNLRSYRPTPYEPVSWPVVSTTSKEEAFSPLRYERVSEPRYVVDPMFANFDQEIEGTPKAEAPDNVVTSSEDSLEDETVVSAEDLIVSEEVPLQIKELKCVSATEAQEVAEVQPVNPEENQSAMSVSDDIHGSGSLAGSTSISNLESSIRFDESIEFEERVQQEARKLNAAAQEERGQMLAQVQEVAYSKARDDTRQEFSTRFETIVDDTKSQVEEMCRDYERQAVDLAFQIAKKLLGSIVTERREYIHEVIAEALKAAGNAEITCIRVSPQDYEVLNAPQTRERSWNIESDDSIGAGCIVVTSTGDVDFDLEKSWARMREKVTRGPKL